MKLKHVIEKDHTWIPYRPKWAAILILALCCLGLSSAVQGQKVVDPATPIYTRPSWWFGIAGAGNMNFYLGSTQQLTADLAAPMAFHQGLGLGLYLAPLVEFHRPTSHWGLMFQAGYDSRRGTYNTEFSPCNCPRDLRTKLNYVTAEPSLRFAPFKGNFYLYGGPRVAYNVQKSFAYKQGTNPAYPEQVAEPDIKGDLSNVKPLLVSAQIGLGYDIQLSSNQHRTQWVISPFASFQPYFGQSPRTIETWNITTLRGGVAIKFGRGTLIPVEKAEAIVLPPIEIEEVDPVIAFTTHAPANVAVQRNMREIFPLRNYVFFDLGSTALPQRYILLRKDQVAAFEEKQVQLSTPKTVANRSERQMLIYYNILNILGDRMVKNPGTRVTLVGSSEQGPVDGKALSMTVKTYLVDIFGIDESRIKVEGRTRPELSSQTGGTRELDLLRAGDRRVTIESSSPILLMEFTSGPGAPLRPIEITGVQEAPLDSYVTFDAKGANALESWSLEIMDEKGIVQKFGPYYQEEVSIPGKSILGSRLEGDYTIKMIGITKSGKEIKKFSYAHMVLWTPPADKEVTRFSVIYEFDESKTVSLYEKYLREIVVPKIPLGGTVVLHGYTDVIGEEDHNQALSLARANDVKTIMEQALAAKGRKDVKFEVHGFGEDPNLAQFENTYPEERFYNRAVMIDIIPAQ